MKLCLLILIAVAGLLGATSMASNPDEAMNGHLIAEPKLQDYVKAKRSPGFSPITEIQDANGNPVEN
ncbi:MAG: hypothetical protein KGP28_12890 [Bdellovibrionales bacterium]|nr:hypothetical protein [Bdellovibrionales bacterium]